MYVNRPVSPTVYAPYQAPTGGNAPAPVTVAVNQYQAPQQVAAANGPSILSTLGGIVSGLFNFVKNLFGKLFGAANTPGTNPGTVVTQPQPATPAPVDDATLAAQFGLLNTPANVAAFRQVLAAQQAEADVIGPGSTNADAVKELQTLLAAWGFPVQQTGQFDPATADAVMSFKAQAGLTENFQFANGQPGVTPFIDTRTRTKMLQLLESGTTPAVPGVSSTPAPLPPTPAIPAPAPTPVPSVPTPSPAPVLPTPAAGTLSAEEQQIANQFGILASRENFDAFMAEAGKLESDAEAIGPNLNAKPEAVQELQQILQMWGYTVQVNGQFDDATVKAVNKFKQDNNLTYNFKMADGSAGVHPFIDARTKDAMIKKLDV